MPLTHAQQTGLEAAILAYLAAAEGGRFVRTAAAFKEEMRASGGGGDDQQGNLVVSGAVLEKAWASVQRSAHTEANKTTLYDAIKAGDLAEVQLYECAGVEVGMLKEEIYEDGDYRMEASPLY